MKHFIFYLFLFIPLASHAAISGSVKSFEQSFERLLKSDGNDAEELDVEIGKMITSHPTNFLRALSQYESRIQRLDALIGNAGPEFVDNEEKLKGEFSKRISSLEKAKSRTKDPELKRLADKCIKLLKDHP